MKWIDLLLTLTILTVFAIVLANAGSRQGEGMVIGTAFTTVFFLFAIKTFIGFRKG